MKYLFVILLLLSGCATQHKVYAPPPPHEPRGSGRPPCDGVYFPDKGCVKDPISATAGDRGHNESITNPEPTR